MSQPDASMPPAPRLAEPRIVRGSAALRALAAAFAHLQDFDGFVRGLQTALDQTEWFGRVTIELADRPGAGEAQFLIGEMTLPVQGATGAHGLLRAAGRDMPRFFGAEDLYLLSGLADFLAVVLDRAREWRETARHRQLLGFLLNQAPVGILAFDEQHRVAAANDLARRWLGGGDLWSAVQAALPEELRARGAVPRACFHLRLEGRLIFGELRTAPGAGGEAGVGVVVMTDLTSDQARLLEVLRRETYRCQWRHLRLALALLESPRIAGGLLQRLPELRAALPASVTAGPYDANRVGLVFPEGGRATAVAQLRRLKAVLPDGPVRAGVAELGRETGEPEVLLQAALAGLRPLQEMTRPALLLHDDDGAVNDTLAYVLGRDFELEKSTSLEQAQQLLRTRSFDGLITEVELRGASGLELARLARELQPGIRPFFTTIAELPAATAGTADLADAVVFQKPFDARALAQTVREKLGLGDAVARTE
jgi:PAS domain-containing protein/CheY-like chemotaxis protein